MKKKCPTGGACGDELIEYICQENNIDLVHVNAPAQLP